MTETARQHGETPDSAARAPGAASGAAALAFSVGLYLAILQFAYFFLLEAYVSSRAVIFFVSLFFWLLGFFLGLKQTRFQSPRDALAASLAAYLLAFTVVQVWPYNRGTLAGVGLLEVISGFAPGVYFPWARRQFPKVKSLFFHENNGFVLGILLSLVGAVTAGGFLLRWGPIVAMAPVLVCALWVFAGRRRAVASAPRSRRPPFVPFVTGLHLGVLQVALFLAIQTFFTATFVGYFAVVLFWMVGVVWALRRPWPRRLGGALVVSLLAYFCLLGLVMGLAPYPWLTPLLAGLVVLAALPAGTVFRRWSRRMSAGPLFFHENNGFCFGYAVMLLAFCQWGVHALLWAPVLTFAVSALAARRARLAAWALLPIGAAVTLVSGSLAVGGLLGAAALVGAVTLGVRPRAASASAATASVPEPAADAAPRLGPWEARALLVLAGFNLLLLEFLLTRLFSTVLAACELSILVVALAYFTGFSVGYGLVRAVRMPWIRRLALPALLGHAALLVATKPVAGLLIAKGYGSWVLVSLLFACAFLTSTLYSILLPKLIESGAVPRLERAYSWDLLGAAAAVVGIGLLTLLAPGAVLPVYLGGMALLLAIVLRGSRWRASFGVIATALVVALSLWGGRLGTLAIQDYYHTRGYDHPRVRFAGHSFYHTVEVIDSFRDEAQTRPRSRSAFLNGVRYFAYRYGDAGGLAGETGLSEFTYFLAQVPARLQYERLGRKLDILILGAGSMYSLHRVRPYARRTTLVEIDAMVVESSRRHWGDVNRVGELDPAQTEIVIDDAKHFLMTTERRFDLVVMDISAPYYLGTALLHNTSFYRLVKRRLRPGGLFSESTQSRPNVRYPTSTSMKILRSVSDVFPYWRCVDGRSSPRGRHGYVYATRRAFLRTKDIVAILKRDGRYRGTSTYSERSSHFQLARVEPFSLDSMETLLTANRSRMRRRLKATEDEDAPTWRDLRLPNAVWRAAWTPRGGALLGLVALLALGARRLSPLGAKPGGPEKPNGGRPGALAGSTEEKKDA